METLRIPLRIVFYREDEWIVAHCLEFDLMGHGKEYEDACDSLFESIFIQIHESIDSGNSSNLFSPAPGEFFRMFAAGKSVDRVGKAIGELKINIENMDLSDIVAREYIDTDNHHDNFAMA
jgi:hypothetical protein